MSPNLFLQVTADAAQWMIESGAEVSYVQDTIEAFGTAIGLRETTCFALPTGVILTVVDSAGFTATVVRRISSRSINLGRLLRLQAIVRQAIEHPPALAAIYQELQQANQTKPYPSPLAILAGGITAGSFAMFFGGAPLDGLAAMLLGLAVIALRLLLERSHLPEVFFPALGGFLAVAGSSLLALCGWPLRASTITIGTLMLLVPGLALVHSLRDLVSGDLVSSLSRMAEVALIGAAIALGAATALALIGHLPGWTQ